MTLQSIPLAYLMQVLGPGLAPSGQPSLERAIRSAPVDAQVQLRVVDRDSILAIYRARESRGSLDDVVGGNVVVSLLERATAPMMRMAVVELGPEWVLSAWLAPAEDRCIAAIAAPRRDTSLR